MDEDPFPIRLADQITLQSDENRQAVCFHLTAHRGEWTVSVSAAGISEEIPWWAGWSACGLHQCKRGLKEQQQTYKVINLYNYVSSSLLQSSWPLSADEYATHQLSPTCYRFLTVLMCMAYQRLKSSQTYTFTHPFMFVFICLELRFR